MSCVGSLPFDLILKIWNNTIISGILIIFSPRKFLGTCSGWSCFFDPPFDQITQFVILKSSLICLGSKQVKWLKITLENMQLCVHGYLLLNLRTIVTIVTNTPIKFWNDFEKTFWQSISITCIRSDMYETSQRLMVNVWFHHGDNLGKGLCSSTSAYCQ